MNPNDSPEDNSVPTDVARTQAIESNPGSGTPLHVGGVRCQLVTPPAIPDHELLRVIGHGAYGEVWLARNIMGAYRAVKIVFRDTFESDRPYEREFSGIQSFEPISRSHESQMDILHVGRNETERYFYYVMELADDVQTGRQITSGSYKPKTIHSELKRRGRFAYAETLEISLALTTAVEHLHKHGLIHRDIKPANVIFLNGLPKLADIGLVTETGGTISFVGTEGYLPPEGPGSVQADIYSLGKTLYEVATGKDRMEFPELPTLTDSPAEEGGLFELNEVLLKACHPDPQKRYRTASEMHADLVLLLAGKSIRRSRALEQRLALLAKIAAGVLLVASLSAAAYVYQQFQTREARRLAQAETFQRTRAEGLLNTLQLKEAEHYFEDDEAGKGVAYIARMLRQDPSNQVATARLMSALTERSFVLPLLISEFLGTVEDMEFSPDGSRIVAWSGSGVAWLLDATTGRVAGKPMRHDKPLTKVGFSPDGRWIATASEDNTARFWHAATGEPVGTPLSHHEPLLATQPSIGNIAFSGDSHLLATVSRNKVRVWKVPSGEPVISPIEAGNNLLSAEFSPDGNRILTWSESGRVQLWDARTGAHLLALVSEGVISFRGGTARFSPDGSRIAAAGGDDLFVWDARSGEVMHRLRHEGAVTAFQFSPDGLRIATGDSAQAARVWDAHTGHLLIQPLVHKESVISVAFDPTGERLLTYEFPRARLWDSRTGRPLTEWWGKLKQIRFSSDGRQVLAMTWGNKSPVLWDLLPGKALNVALLHQTAVASTRFSPDGTKVITAAGGYVFSRTSDGPGSGAAMWDVRTGQSVIPRIKSTSGMQYAEFSPDGRRFVTASLNGHARIWDGETGAPVTERLEHGGPVRGARFSWDGRKVVTASDDKTARVWDAQTGQPITDPLLHVNPVTSAEFSPDGRWILTVERFSPRIWDAQTGEALELGLSHTFNNVVREARFSPDGQRILTASGNGTAQIWESQTGKRVGEAMKHQDEVWSARFSPDGRLVVTASMDETARLWDASTGKPLTEPLVHSGPVIGSEFSRDGRRVVTFSADNTARVWDTQTGRPLTEWLRHDGAVGYGEFSPDGNLLVTASADGTARIWELPPAQVSVPEWVLDLAEAVAGQRLLDQEVPERVLPQAFLDLKQRIIESRETDHYTAWAKWLLGDRLKRNTSVSSATTGADHLGRLIERNSVQTLREALRLSPNHAAATARLAREILAKNAKEYQHEEQVAAFLADRALKLKPDEPQAWWAKTAVLEQTGRQADAFEALDRALALAPESLELWKLKGAWLEKAGRDEEALQACSKAAALTELSREIPAQDEELAKARQTMLLKRAEILARLGRHEEAVTERLRALGIPLRDPQTPTALLDLSAHYNRSLLDDQGLWKDPMDRGKDDLASLAVAQDLLAGVRFDLRASVLVGHSATPAERERMAVQVRGISVNQQCRRLHFLHAVHFGPRNIPLARYVVHYEDDRREEIPVVIGQTAGSWFLIGTPADHGESEPAWQEANVVALVYGVPAQLYKFSWVNPWPEVRITSLDLELTESKELVGGRGISLVAITAQNEPTPVITSQPRPQTVAAGEDAAFHVEAQSENPLAYQWQFNGVDLPGATNATFSIKGAALRDAGTYTAKVRNAIAGSLLALVSLPGPLVVKAGGLNYGALKRELFTNVVGKNLVALASHPGFPNNPDTVDAVYQFETPVRFADNYGIRLSGYLVPPKTGEYRFYLCADDEGALFLSTNESPGNKRRIAHEPVCNGERLWTATHSRPNRENVSGPIQLEGGRAYYIEALMKEGDGGDNLAVAWQLPGEPLPENLAPPIPGTYLFFPNVAITSHPRPQIVSAGEDVNFQVEAEGDLPLAYQWLFNDAELPGATNAVLSLKSVAREHIGMYGVRVWQSSQDSRFSRISQPALLLLKTDGLSHGMLRREVFTSISGGNLGDLTNHVRFPDSPNTTEFVVQFETPSNVGNDYGVRLSGYLVPPKTGDYRFYLCSDNNGALFLSTNGSPDNKRQIAHEPTWSRGRQWTAILARPNRDNISKAIHLEAGRHYYIEAMMKEDDGSDNLGVAWQMPGDPPPENFSPPIPSTYLAVPTEWLKPVVTAKGPELPPGSE